MRLPDIGFEFGIDSDNTEKTLTKEQKVEALRQADPETYAAIFGKGVSKGSKEVTTAKVAAAIDENTANMRSALRTERVDRALRKKAAAAGFFDPEDVVDLLSKNFDLNADLEVCRLDGSEIDLDDAIKELSNKRPHLVKPSPQKPGQNSVRPPMKVNNLNNGEQKTFKRSQLRDSAFYAANEEAILKAAKLGNIVDDIGS